jgi:ABC-2 type transport system ATP-binding protein
MSRQGAEDGVRISVRGLRVRFGAVEAVRGIDLTAYGGRGTALLGRNGAGKSTTMRVLAGVIPPTEGAVLVDGVDVAADPLAVKRGSGYCPDVGGLIPRATPWEHLQLAARLRRLENWELRAQDLLERFDLAAAAHRVTGGFSHGMGGASPSCSQLSANRVFSCSTSPSTASTRWASRPPSR